MPDAVDGVEPGIGARPGMLGCATGPGAVGAATGADPFCIAPAGAVAAGIAPVAPGGFVGAVMPGEPAAGGGGCVWPNVVSAKVKEHREAVSSFFIGLNGKVGDQPA